MPTRPELRRRGVLVAVSLLALAACAGCGEVHARLALGPPRPLTVAIDGPPSALYAPLYTAAANGDFTLGALRVTIAQPPDALRALESGAANVAIVSEPALLAARDGGAPVVAIGALVNGPLEGIVSLAGDPIASPAALSGQTVEVSPTRLAGAEMFTILGAHPGANTHWMSVSGSLEAALASGRAKATLGDPWPLEVAMLEAAHRRPIVLEAQRAGVPTYSRLVIAVRVGEAHDDGPLLRAFLQSLTRGERAVAANPAAAAATLAKVNPRLSAAIERRALGELLPLVSPSGAGEPFGYQDPLAWGTFGVWMRQQGMLHGTRSAALAITDEFLPGQGE